MPLDEIKNRLPFLTGTTDRDAQISEIIRGVRLTYQSQFGVSDTDLDDDSAYTPLQNHFVDLYACRDLLVQEAVQTAGGSGGSGGGSKTLTKAKAEGVETEFEPSKAGDGGSLLMTTKDLIAQYEQEICTVAKQLKIKVPFCRGAKPSRTPVIVSGWS